MAYTDIDDPTIYFNTKLYTGNGSTGHVITGVGFQPDWVWLKNRNTTNTHEAFDSVRGATKTLYPDRSDAEYVNATGSLTSFNSDGFTVGSGDGANKSGSGIASWNWKAGGSASSNTDGSITSTVSANTTAGFSIVSYSGNATTGATVGTGLNSVPQWVMVKSRTNGADWWGMYLSALGNNKSIFLNDSSAEGTRTYWNNTTPTSSVFTVSNERSVNGSGENFIAYCFAEKKGYSKFGSYRGNGGSQNFIFTGFKPAMVIIKRTDSAGYEWRIVDNKRLGYNGASYSLNPNDSSAEGTSDRLDFLSNGIKLTTSATSFNASGGTYIYMAFAESPFVNSNGVPNNAR